MNIYDYIFNNDNADCSMICYCDKMISYQELKIYSENIASLINNRYGVGKEAIGLFISGSDKFCIGLFSILKSGKIAVPINVNSKYEEIERLRSYLGIRFFISETNVCSKLTELKEQPCDIIVLGENGDFEIICKADEISEYYTDNELDDVAVILHTSGSLSFPKSVMLTHENIIVSAEAIAKDLEITSADRSLIILPVYYSSALIGQLFAHMIRGASVIFTNTLLSPKAVFMNAEKYGITNYSMVPGLMNETEAMLDKLECYDISSIRYICVSGGAVQGKRANHFANAYPEIKLIRTYGLTETSTRVSHYRQLTDIVTDSCVGFPLDDCCIEVRKKEKDCHYGDIYVKGKNIMKGYYNRCKDTSKVLADGWLNTGDVGFIDDYGQLHVIGRNKNIIIRNGENIYPEEIEEVICGFTSVKEAHVYGMDDDIYGQVPVAEIVLYEGYKFDENELIKYCRCKMTGSKVPVKYKLVNEIPKTSNGKINRRKDLIKWREIQ